MGVKHRRFIIKCIEDGYTFHRKEGYPKRFVFGRKNNEGFTMFSDGLSSEFNKLVREGIVSEPPVMPDND